MIRRPPRSTLSSSSAASDVYKRQVYRTAAFGFDSAEDYRDVLAGERAGYAYSRYDNPTADAFAAAVAALEGAGLDREVVGQPFASGMAAISAALWTLTRSGGRVVACLLYTSPSPRDS